MQDVCVYVSMEIGKFGKDLNRYKGVLYDNRKTDLKQLCLASQSSTFCRRRFIT
jgi:hypothetical protein